MTSSAYSCGRNHPIATLRTKEHKRLAKLQRDFIVGRGHNPDRLEMFMAVAAPTITPASTTVIGPLPTGHQRGTP